ncbi:hypothetical protein BD779DRAFT_1669156 [Infundibulicybe gibba]|nr:hypothetical protein BD779DRAFT_1669156 [Infundibulicybe gibba]
MAVQCAECGGETTWQDDVGSTICTNCGTLGDPSQSVLDSHSEQIHTVNYLWDPASTTTLKSFRTGSGWDLAGQGKEAGVRRKTFAIHALINSVAASLSATAVSPRAINLFNQTMAKNHHKWGRTAKLVAGSCVYIALRESSRTHSLHDIASFLEERETSLSRTLHLVTSSLNTALPPATPNDHILSLQEHLESILQDKSGLTPSIVTQLKSLPRWSVNNTANSLSSLLIKRGPDAIKSLPTAPTACAILILALEAETRTIIPNLAELSHCLAARCHITKVTVLSRYKLIQDEIAKWINSVPWLDKYERPGHRAKVGKRLIVARGLKDVIQFEDHPLNDTHKCNIPLVDRSDDDKEDDLSDGSHSPQPAVRINRLSKRRKAARENDPVRAAAQFLLNPLSAPIPVALDIETGAPTRLQALCALRGGEVPDDELFAEGELEAMFRTEDEIRNLEGILDWGNDPDDSAHENDSATRKRKQPTSAALEEPRAATKKQRVDMGAFLRFMEAGDESKDDAYDVESDSGLEDDDEERYESTHNDQWPSADDEYLY